MAALGAPTARAQALRMTLDPEGALPVELTADRVQSVLDRRTVAEGSVALRQGALRLSTDQLTYTHADRQVSARGQVHIEQAGSELRGTEAEITLDTRIGHVLSPSYHFAQTGAGGRASRIDFYGSERLLAESATYSSCRIDDPDTADWVLSADKLTLDFANNDGRAEGTVLRFLGVPILAAPVLSFPVTGERKSGWLPPTVYAYDSRSGFQFELPYYFNLAPDHDLTLTPGMLMRRGLSLGGEFRYLMPHDEGSVAGYWLPNDRTVGTSRYSLLLKHQGGEDGAWRYGANIEHASDDAFWKDFSRAITSSTPRLLAQQLQAERSWTQGGQSLQSYARVQGWRTLQVSDAVILPPYQRLPQLGLRGLGTAPGALSWSLEGEYNRFTLRDVFAGSDNRGDGERLHLLGALSRPTDPGWGWLTPKLSFNAASYRTDLAMSDGRTRASRLIPTLALDSGLRFEREAALWGSPLRQTLEPRLHYVRTPWRNQDTLPNFDSAELDFNELSIYGDNAFSGIDYVTDANQLTVGVTSRWFDNARGAELLRLGIAQRYLFSTQRITTDRLTTNGLSAEADSTTARRFSDLLLFGSTSLIPRWHLDGRLQYNSDLARTSRAVFAARWQPEPFHTLSATYRYTRDLSEQVELGWQWPIYRGTTTSDGRCSGSLYGVGRVNYSLQDQRFNDAIAGVEYDAGCWIGRVVAKRVSTGQSEATTQLMVQLELIGLSRLGANPLKVLKDNIPGYQLLRDDTDTPSTAP